MQECPLYVWTPPYVWMPCICLDAPTYVLMMFGCLLYIHNTKKACFVILRRCPYTPIHLDAPYVLMPPICLDDPCIFGYPHMFGHPHMFGCPLYVWMPAVHIQHKESMLCQTKGVSICPHMFGYSPVCLGTPVFGCPLNMCGHSHMFGCPMYVWKMFGCPL